MDPDIRQAFSNLATLVGSTGASIEAELREEMRTGFQRIEAATARNTKVLAGGSKTVAALMAWTVKCDARDRKRDQELRDLQARVQKLERRLRRGSERRAS